MNTTYLCMLEILDTTGRSDMHHVIGGEWRSIFQTARRSHRHRAEEIDTLYTIVASAELPTQASRRVLPDKLILKNRRPKQNYCKKRSRQST